MIKILIGGSPCTFWSIAQKNNREVEAKGLGWELFRNYLIAKEKFKPDFFLYENNKSAAQPIKDQISRALGVELMHINSALVSAQNRQRFYAFNWSVEQPEDRGIILRDIIEEASPQEDNDCRELVGVGYRNRREADGKLYRRFETDGDAKANALTTVATDSMVAIPICVNSKSGRGGVEGLQPSLQNRIFSTEGKSPALTTSYIPKIAIPLRVGTMPQLNGTLKDNQATRIYSVEGKSVTLSANGGGWGAKGGLYAIPASREEKDVFEVKNGLIEIKGRSYPIKLENGFYIIRKPTVRESCRLQTLPDDYCRAVSDSQARKGLGNGWTAEVIIHILNGALKDVPRDEQIVVLSMYDGIGTGRYCLDKMGFTNVTYYAYEIDEPAMKVSRSNYPDIIQLGDAFNLRRDDWELGKVYDEAPPAPELDQVHADEEATDLSEAPEEIKEEIIKNAELLTERDGEEEKMEDETMETNTYNAQETTAENIIDFNAAEQLRRLAAERKALANLKPENTRFSDDVRAIEYAISVMEAVGL